MKPAKLSFFSNLTLIVITVILLICSLSLSWLGSKVETTALTTTTEVTLTKIKVTVEALGQKSSTSTDLGDSCDYGSKNAYCKLSKASDGLITLSTFGMAAIIAAGVIIILDLCCKMSKKSPIIFRIIYIGTVIAGFVLFLVSFIEYNVVADDVKTDGVKYKSGWILYLVSMIFSFFILLLGLSNLLFKS